MDDFLSTGCRVFRYCLAIIGCILAATLISFGLILRQSGGGGESNEDSVVIALGSILAIMSCTIGCVVGIGDRQVRKLVAAMEAEQKRLELSVSALEREVTSLSALNDSYNSANDEHRRIIREAEERFKARLKEMRETNKSLEEQVQTLGRQSEAYQQENRNLSMNVARLEKFAQEYSTSMARLREIHESAQQEIDHLRAISSASDMRVQQLDALAADQRVKIDELTKQAENLSELQRKSVRMIQMLAVYGDECKTLNTGLADVAAELKKTDSNLGLTAEQMAIQLKALQAITLELKQVARGRGYGFGDDDDDD